MNFNGFRVASLVAASALAVGCGQGTNPVEHGSASVRLKPATTPVAGPVVRHQVYVPVYSSIYWGVRPEPAELAATVSIRNVSSNHVLVLEAVQYFDSAGKPVREYLSGPSELGPLASVEFVIQQRDKVGGPGANFLVSWSGSTAMDEPVVEAIMLGQTGSASISFTSPGRVLKDKP
jgi:hypothetical protein